MRKPMKHGLGWDLLRILWFVVFPILMMLFLSALFS